MTALDRTVPGTKQFVCKPPKPEPVQSLEPRESCTVSSISPGNNIGAYYISGGTVLVKVENTWNQGTRSLEDKVGGPSNFTILGAEEPFT